MTTSLWLSGSLRSFLYSSLYSYTSSQSHLHLLGPCYFCPLLCPSLREIFPWYLQFSWRDVQSFPFYYFPLFLFIVHLRLSYLSLLFSGTLHLAGYIFPFLLCLSLLFFSQLFVRSPQTTGFPYCISFYLGHHLLYNVTNLIHSSSGTLSTRSQSPESICYLHYVIINEFDLGYTWMAQFKPEFCNKELMIWATVSSRSYFC